MVLAPQVMLLDVNHITEGRITMMQRKVHGMKLTIFTCYYPTEETIQKAICKVKTEPPSFKVIPADVILKDGRVLTITK